MTEENKTEKKTEVVEEKPRGERGEVGTASTSLMIHQMWHGAHFKKVSVKNDEGEHIRFTLVRNPGAPSLKQYAKGLVRSESNQTAKDWLAHKKGSLNQKRSDNNIKIAREAFSATKTERRKKKGSN